MRTHSRDNLVEQSRVDRGADTHHLAIATAKKGERPFAIRILDLRRDYPPVTKELGFRAVAASAGFAGSAWCENIRLEDRTLWCECYVQGFDGALARVDVPIEAFEWTAAAMARSHGVKPPYEYYLRVLDMAHHQDILTWSTRAGAGDNADFEIASSPEEQLRLPKLDGVRVDLPPGRRRIISESPTWLKCVFVRKAFDAFLVAAAAETTRERAWAGLGDAFIDADQCVVVIHDWIELPAAEAGPSFLRTTGAAFAGLHGRVCARLVAYAHLHPARIEGRSVAAAPSGPDTIVAWNFDGATALPCVFPIARFGASHASLDDDLGVYGFEAGVLRKIQVEVLQ